MTINVRLLPDQGMVFVKYTGFVSPQASIQAFRSFLQDPNAGRINKHLIDLADVTRISTDYVELMQLQAEKTDGLLQFDTPVMLAYHAPTELGLRVAAMVMKSWDGLSGIVTHVAATEPDALHFLGRPETSFSQLLQDA